MVRNRTNELFYFNVIKLGPETPTAPGRGEKRPFGDRFGHSLHSRSPERTPQTPANPRKTWSFPGRLTGGERFAPRVVASPAGFEPTAPRLGIWCSILLSYGDLFFLLDQECAGVTSLPGDLHPEI
jgi:hypothetical protein